MLRIIELRTKGLRKDLNELLSKSNKLAHVWYIAGAKFIVNIADVDVVLDICEKNFINVDVKEYVR